MYGGVHAVVVEPLFMEPLLRSPSCRPASRPSALEAQDLFSGFSAADELGEGTPCIGEGDVAVSRDLEAEIWAALDEDEAPEAVGGVLSTTTGNDIADRSDQTAENAEVGARASVSFALVGNGSPVHVGGDEQEVAGSASRQTSSRRISQVTRSNLRLERSLATSSCQVANDGGQSTSLTRDSEIDEFDAITEKGLVSEILKQGSFACLFALVGVLAGLLCIILITSPLSSLAWPEAMELRAFKLATAPEASFQCWIYSWVSQVLGFLAACFCLLGCFWVREWYISKRPEGRQCCEDIVERSRNRAEDAENRAHKAHRAKQQFIAYVFHNIRVPFNAIVLGLGHLRATVDKEASNGEVREKMDLVQMMLDCAETMTSVLDDVTDMGLWEEGAMELSIEEFDLLAVVKFLSWGLKDLLYQKQICFSMNVDPVAKELLTANNVLGDKHRVLQTLGNFLSNAVKFTPAGGRLELSIKCEDFFHGEVEHVSGKSGAKNVPKLQDCSLCPCLRVEASRKALGSHSNAERQLCSSSGAELTLNSQQSDSTNDRSNFAKLLISVKDTGIGISAEEQAKLFEPYSFVTSGWVQKAAVSGLGLSMAKRFAEQSGGYIGVKSVEGEGSNFYFAIPYPLVPVKHSVEYKLPYKEECLSTSGSVSQEDLKSLDASSIPVKSDPSILQEKKHRMFSSSFSPRIGKGRRVLLVEDTEINRIILRKVLQNLNLHCEEAENGQVAVDFFKQGRTYDLILMDKEMPVMDGHEATRQLRMMGVKTPIVALTGNALQSDRELFFKAGVDDFQTKPLSRDKLVQLLARFGVESSCGDRRG